MIVMTPVTESGQSAGHFGKAHWVAVANVDAGRIIIWRVHEVAWDESHDIGTHGAHHARVAKFLMEQGVETVITAGMGAGMRRMIDSMRIQVLQSSTGDAKASVLTALADLG